MDQLTAINRTLRAILWAALAIGIVAMSLGVRQVDLWWQLPDGLAILGTHHLPDAPTTAFGLAAAPYVDEYSLYEIGLAALFQVGGLGAIHVAFVVAYLLIFALPFAFQKPEPRDLVSGALVAFAALFVINRFEQRPEIIGVLMLVLLIRLLLRTRNLDRGFLLRLVLLMTVWSNVHSSYLIGLFALAAWLAQCALRPGKDTRWTLPACAATFGFAAAAVLVNPYGLERVVFTFAQQRDPGSNLLSPEMWPAWAQNAVVRALMGLAAALLALALASRQRLLPWLGALAATLFVLTLFNIRHMSFLAVPLLYLAAHRRVIEPRREVTVMLAPLLALACVGALLFDVVALREAVAACRSSATDEVRHFAPAVMARVGPEQAGAVLCHDAAGSYLTYAFPRLHPYMDSGQGRFDDSTKRLYFFAVYDAGAFDRLLRNLPQVNDVLVTSKVEAWALAMIGRPGWHLAACDYDGLLFRRMPDAAKPLDAVNPTETRILAACRDRAMGHGDLVRAFCFSALIDPPEKSLALLDRTRADAWTERFYSFTRAWLQSLAPGDVQAFGEARPHPANSLLNELLLERLPNRPLLSPGPTDLEHFARVALLMDRGQTVAAAAIFRSLRKPLASPLYYTLRGRLDLEAARAAPAAERWQNWNDGGDALVDRTLSRLNARASILVDSSSER